MVTRLALMKELAATVPENVSSFPVSATTALSGESLLKGKLTCFIQPWACALQRLSGLAWRLPNRKVMALDSDGNLILNLGVLGHDRQ